MHIQFPRKGQGEAPSVDGQVTTFVDAEAAAAERYFDHDRTVVFVNGMANSGEEHQQAAFALSLMQMCTVVGVYNATGGFVIDLMQCLGDKQQFDGVLADSASSAIGRASGGRGGVRASAAEDVLRRNPASASMFRLLRGAEFRGCEVFAHSQGNLILSNALSAIEAVDGASAVGQFTVYTFGSPARSWPRSTQLVECGFTFDPVTWMAGMDFSFSISKLGMPADSNVPITHSFKEYLFNDEAFVVNRFRWGGLGVTFSLDEAGLAHALVRMGHNLPRVTSVFRYLAKYHWSDVDDVALLYIEELQHAPQGPGLLQAIRSERTLLDLLVRALEGGWTSGRERAAIEFLKRP